MTLGLEFNCALLSLLPRVDRARWIVALTEHKQAGVFTCKDGKSQSFIYQTFFQMHFELTLSSNVQFVHVLFKSGN